MFSAFHFTSQFRFGNLSRHALFADANWRNYFYSTIKILDNSETPIETLTI
jgi:hypothetical protein